MKRIMTRFYNNILGYIRRINLKKRLVAVIIAAIFVPVMLSYIVLIYCKGIMQNETQVMVRNTASQISQSIDEMLKGQVYSISEILMYDERIYDYLVNKKYNSNGQSRQKIIDEILLADIVSNKYMYSANDIQIASLYGRNGEYFNIHFPPADQRKVLEKIMPMVKDSRRMNLVIQWYPLYENFFSGNLPKDKRMRFVNIASRAMFQPQTGEYVGNEFFTIYEKAIYEKYQNIKLGKSGYILVTDKNGNLISHSDETKLASGIIKDFPIMEILKETNSVFIYNTGKKHVLVAKSESQFNSWVTVGIVPLDEIYGGINRIYTVILLVIAATTMLVLTYVIFVSDGIVKPIRAIINTIEKVEKGDLSARVDIKGEYEISNLGRYFNNMVGKIDQLIQNEYILEKKKKEAELNVLMAQINPHFLYNTLESIAWKSRSVGAIEISEMAASLGKLFRISVNRGNLIVTVDEELEHARAYINIQKLRYGNKFDFIINVSDEKLLKYKMLKLVLQPLIENALSYGMEPSKKGGTITVNVKIEGSSIIFEVVDNGAGISSDKLNEIENRLYSDQSGADSGNCCTDEKNEKYKCKGIGLKNVHERIKLYFGAEYGIRIFSKEKEGTTVTAVLPLMEECDLE
jgi:two-component system, sensor histidine kinase YesM